MTTVLDIVTAAGKEIGVYAAGETPAAADASDGFDALNSLLDQFAAERLEIYTVTRTTFTISSGTQTYAVGTGSVVNVARPVYIDEIRFQDTSVTPTLEYPLTPLTEDAYAAIPQKTLTSPFPSSWYYNPTFPTGTITFWPKPTASNLQGVLYAPTAVAQFAALSDSVSLPPGYRRMLVKNLAVEMGPAYGKQADQVLMHQAAEAKEVVKRANRRLVDLGVDAAALIQGSMQAAWDIRTGP